MLGISNQAKTRDPIYRCRCFESETIELCVRRYLTYRLSYCDLAAMMAERGVAVSHTTIMGWVLRYVPEFEKRRARYARPVHSSWRMDETAVSVRGGRHYVRTCRYLNNIVEQDHRAIKRRCASMLSLKSFRTAAVTLSGIELAHRVRKRQFSFGRGRPRKFSSLKELCARALA